MCCFLELHEQLHNLLAKFKVKFKLASQFSVIKIVLKIWPVLVCASLSYGFVVIVNWFAVMTSVFKLLGFFLVLSLLDIFPSFYWPDLYRFKSVLKFSSILLTGFDNLKIVDFLTYSIIFKFLKSFW